MKSNRDLIQKNCWVVEYDEVLICSINLNPCSQFYVFLTRFLSVFILDFTDLASWYRIFLRMWNFVCELDDTSFIFISYYSTSTYFITKSGYNFSHYNVKDKLSQKIYKYNFFKELLDFKSLYLVTWWNTADFIQSC